MPNQNWHLNTKVVHGAFSRDPETGATVPPIYQTASFSQPTGEGLSDIFHGREYGYIYSRIANPTVAAFEQHCSTIENGLGAVAVASGMAAITIAIQALASTGDHIVAAKSLFGGTYYALQELVAARGMTVTYVDTTDIDAYKNAITPQTKLIYCEGLGNPKLDMPDFKRLSDVAKAANIPLVVDSTTSTPVLFQAKTWGVDIVVHSATKWMSGSGTTIGGVIIDLGTFKWRATQSSIVHTLAEKFGPLAFLTRCKKLRSNLGCSLSPQSAFAFVIGMETLSLRVEKQCENALALAQFFEKHPHVTHVGYPGLPGHEAHALAKTQLNGGFGGLITIRLGSQERCFTCIRHLKMVKNLANLGDAKTLVIHPASTIYRDLTPQEREEAGTYDDLLRISVGIEHIQDIIQDFTEGLEALS